jgi:hypothetical protein
MANAPFKIAFFGDGGTEAVQGTTFYHDIGGYSSGYVRRDGEFAAAGPSVQAVARFIHSQSPPLPGKLTPLHLDHFFHQGA